MKYLKEGQDEGVLFFPPSKEGRQMLRVCSEKFGWFGALYFPIDRYTREFKIWRRQRQRQRHE